MNTVQVGDKAFELFLGYETIIERIKALAHEITVDHKGQLPIFLGILNGSFIFMSDLIKETDMFSEVEFIRVASYHGTESSGNVKEMIGLTANLKNRDVIIVEDIIDSGLTLKYIIEQLKKHEPASLKVCSLLYKPNAIKEPIEEIAYIGFEIANDFVVGYGLDYDGLGRNLKDIYRAI